MQFVVKRFQRLEVGLHFPSSKLRFNWTIHPGDFTLSLEQSLFTFKRRLYLNEEKILQTAVAADKGFDFTFQHSGHLIRIFQNSTGKPNIWLDDQLLCYDLTEQYEIEILSAIRMRKMACQTSESFEDELETISLLKDFQRRQTPRLRQLTL